MKPTKSGPLMFVIAFACAAALPGLNRAAAAIHVVSNGTDAGPGSLRQAIADSAANGGDEILFSNVTAITLQSSLSLAVGMTITGPGADQLTLNCPNDHPFSISSNAVVTIAGLNIAGSGAMFGGAVYNAGSLLLNQCSVSNSTVSFSGGGIYNSGNLILNRCSITGNFAGAAGGGIYNVGDLTLTNSAISGNLAMSTGGGVYNSGDLNVHLSTISGNGATYFFGGGIAAATGSTMVADCTVSGNFCRGGGGIWNAGQLSVTGSTLSGNHVSTDPCHSPGGGIFNVANAVLVNSTISGNKASQSGQGGGVMNQGTLTAWSCTICSNRCLDSMLCPRLGGGGVYNSGIFNCQNSIIAGNAASAGPDIFGTVLSQGFNLVQNTTDCMLTGDTTHNLLGIDPLLGPLDDNGGPTWTHALPLDSPAIDQGFSNGLTTDQRGFRRPFNIPFVHNVADGSDIGAFELISSAPWLNPMLVGLVNDGGNASGLAAAGPLVYLANGADGLRVYDISDPSRPRSIGHANDGGTALDIALNGRVAALATGADGLRIYDVSDPDQPVSVGHSRQNAIIRAVAFARDEVFAVGDTPCLCIYKLLHHASPSIVSRNPGPSAFANGVAVKDHFAFVASDTNGLAIYDITHPALPHKIAQINDGGEALDVAATGNHAWLANGADGLRVYDMTHPSKPVKIAHIQNGGIASGIAVIGPLVYLANGTDGLRIYDVSVPSRPIPVAHANDGGFAKAVAVTGRFICLACQDQGLKIYFAGGPAHRLDLVNKGGKSRIAVSGLPGDVYRILTSSDLVHWNALTALTNTTGFIEFSDPEGMNQPSRFYRAVMP